MYHRPLSYSFIAYTRRRVERPPWFRERTGVEGPNLCCHPTVSDMRLNNLGAALSDLRT